MHFQYCTLSTCTCVAPDGVSDDGVFVDDGVTDGTVLATMDEKKISITPQQEAVTKSS